MLISERGAYFDTFRLNDGDEGRRVVRTKIIVTRVKRTIMFPCCLVDSAVILADLASLTLAAFILTSNKWLSLECQLGSVFLSSAT